MTDDISSSREFLKNSIQSHADLAKDLLKLLESDSNEANNRFQIASIIIFIGFVVIGGIIFAYLMKSIPSKKREEDKEAKPSIFKKMFEPKFDVYNVPDTMPIITEPKQEEKPSVQKKEGLTGKISSYAPPPIDLLDLGKEVPVSGDIKTNLAVIKRTLQNFGIEVTMSEVNTGPTVTQYTLKPAEGIKLSKITGLSNDLALALAPALGRG